MKHETVGGCNTGREAPVWLRRAAGAGVTLIFDAQGLDALYQSTHLVAAPLPHGGGTKNGTLEAMAWGLPVMSPPPAFTGLSRLNRHVFVCESLNPLALVLRFGLFRRIRNFT